jgi:threonyl-tRNA synthetase
MGDGSSGGALNEDDCELLIYSLSDHCVLICGKGCGSHLTNCITFQTDQPVEAEVAKIVKEKQKFERLVLTKEEALEMFSGNPFKEQIISTKIPDGTRTTVYRCGNLVDLCRGPHVPNTGRIKAFAATRHSATNWLGDTENDSLQRMYGISFPDKKMLKVWMENQEKVRNDVDLGGWCCVCLLVCGSDSNT